MSSCVVGNAIWRGLVKSHASLQNPQSVGNAQLEGEEYQMDKNCPLPQPLIDEVEVLMENTSYRPPRPAIGVYHDSRVDCSHTISICANCIRPLKKVRLQIARGADTRSTLILFARLYGKTKGKSLENFEESIKTDITSFSRASQHLLRSLLHREKPSRGKFLHENDDKRKTQDRHKARDEKNAFQAQADRNPMFIHDDGDCHQLASMCQYCVSSVRINSVRKDCWMSERAIAASIYDILGKANRGLYNDIVRELCTSKGDSARFVLSYFDVFADHIENERIDHLKRCLSKRKFIAQKWGLDINFNMKHSFDISGFTDAVTNFVSSSGLAVSFVATLIGFGTLLSELLSHSSYQSKIRAVVIFVCGLPIPKVLSLLPLAKSLAQVFQRICARVFGKHPDDDEIGVTEEETAGVLQYREVPFVAQADKEEHMLVGVVKLLGSIIGVLPDNVDLNSKRVRKLDVLVRTATCVDRLIQVAHKLFKYAFNFLVEKITGLSPSIKELRAFEINMETWMRTVVDYHHNNGLHNAAHNREDAWKISKWKHDADRYKIALAASEIRKNPTTMKCFFDIYRMVEELYQAGHHFHSRTSLTPEPFVVYAFGAPGVGKSVGQYFILSEVMMRYDKIVGTGRKFSLDQNVYSKNPVDKFWSSFKAFEHRVVLWDDIFQAKDKESMKIEAMEFVRMNNMVPYCINMPDVESKGEETFRAEMVYCTSNNPVPAQDLFNGVIRSPGALLRRFDVTYRQRVKDEFADDMGKIDAMKVAKKYPLLQNEAGKMVYDSRFTDVYVYDIMRAGGHEVIVPDVDYATLVDHLVQCMVRKRHASDILINSLDELYANVDKEKPEKPPRPPPPMETSFCGIGDGLSPSMESVFMGQMLKRKVTPIRLARRVRKEGERALGKTINAAIDTREYVEDVFQDIADKYLADGFSAEYIKNVLGIKVTEAKVAAHVAYIKVKDMITEAMRPVREHIENIFASNWFKLGCAVLGIFSIIGIGYYIFGKVTTKKQVASAEAFASGDSRTQQVVRKVGSERKHTLVKLNAEAAVSGDDKTAVVKKTVKSESTFAVVREKSRTTGKMVESCGELQLWSGDHDANFDPSDPQGFLAQAASDPNAITIMRNRIANNTFVITIGWGNYQTKMRGLFFAGNCFLMPAHAFTGYDHKEGKCTLSLDMGRGGIVHDFTLDECVVVRDFEKTHDLLGIKPPKRVNSYTSLVNHFHKSEELGKHALSKAMLYVTGTSDASAVAYFCREIKRISKFGYVVEGKNAVDVEIINGLRYDAPTQQGECGAPLIWVNQFVQGGKILGLHVAGSSDEGISTMVNHDLIEKLVRKLNPIVIETPDVSPITEFRAHRVVVRDLTYIGQVSGEMQCRQPIKSNIIPSLLHGIFPVTTKPAMLVRNQDIDPLSIGIAKQQGKPSVWDPILVETALNHLSHTIRGMDSVYIKSPHILTVDEALNGVVDDVWSTPMNMKTSPGYPYIKIREMMSGLPGFNAAGKFGFISNVQTEEDPKYVLSPIVARAVEERIALGKTRRGPVTLFVDQLKDEKRPIAKVDAGKTRIFNVAPFDLNVAVRMYFQDFIAHIMANHVYGETSVGLNVHSDSWGALYKHILNNGTNIIGGDYSSYDKKLPYQLLVGVCDVINKFYDDGEENANVRLTLFETMFNAYHIVGRDVYKCHQGNPSGIVMTSIINSLVNALLFRLTWLELGGRMDAYSGHVCMKYYGDDNIGSVSDEAKFFNMRSISDTLATHGVEFTTPDKSEVSSDFLTQEQMMYLKRTFVHSCGRIYAPLSLESIYGMINWIRESHDDNVATVAGYESATREMIHHGRAAFDQFVSYVTTEAHKRRVTLPFVCFEESMAYWGSEDANGVNFEDSESVYRVRRRCHLETEDGLFRSQGQPSASLNIGYTEQSFRRAGRIGLTQSATSTSNTTIQTPSAIDGVPNSEATTVHTRNEIMAFTDTSLHTDADFQHVPPVPSDKMDPYMKQELTDFLQRTYYLTQTWSSTSVFGDLLLKIDFPNFLFAVSPIWDKLKNFAYFRAGVKIGIRINGTRFHYGSLLVAWSPTVDNTGGMEYGYNNVISASGNPCFMVSPSENEVHYMTIPYTIPYAYIPLARHAQPAYALGSVYIYCLNPLTLASTDPTDVSFTIFANFEDVDISGYTFNTYTIPTRTLLTQATHPAYHPTQPALTERSFVAQARREEKEKSEKGVVSGVMESVSGIAGALVSVPEIGELAAGVSVGAGVIGAVASMFGYCNPNTQQALTPIVTRYNNLANTHGLNDTQVLSVFPDNVAKSGVKYMGSHEAITDIMDVMQTPMIVFGNVPWTGDQIASSQIISWQNGPSQLAAAGSGFTIPSFVNFVSTAFQYWRGSIRYHISIVASQMHVGRMRISWVPDVTTVAALTEDNLASAISLVVDLEKETEISFSVPYLRDQPWLEVTQPVLTSNSINGVIVITVLNQLTYPATPIPQVYLNIWASAGSDYQVAMPSLVHTKTTFLTNPPSSDPELVKTFKAQGITREMIRETNAMPLIPGVGSRDDGIMMGESVSNLKEVLMRPMLRIYTVAPTSPTNVNEFLFMPYGGLARVAPAQTYYDYFAQIYRYRRGSMNYKVVPAVGKTTPISARADLQRIFSDGTLAILPSPFYSSQVTGPSQDYSNAFFWNSTTTATGGSGIAISTNLQELPLSVSVPFYNTLFHMNIWSWVGNGVIPEFHGSTPLLSITASDAVGVYQSVGDDFEFGFRVGPPAIAN